MRGQFLRFTLPVALLAALLFAAPAGAIGYWNVPGTFYQCYGCGWGAGHHAPLVLGPVSHHGKFQRNLVRLPYAPSPPYADYCGAPGYDFAEPSRLWFPLEPADGPAAVPPPHPLFGPPVEP